MACDITKTKKEINTYLTDIGITQKAGGKAEKTRKLVNAVTLSAEKAMKLSLAKGMYIDTTITDSKKVYLETAEVVANNKAIMHDVVRLTAIATEDSDLKALITEVVNVINNKQLSSTDKVTELSDYRNRIVDLDDTAYHTLGAIIDKLSGIKSKPKMSRYTNLVKHKLGRLEGMKEQLVEASKGVDDGLIEFLATKPTMGAISTRFQSILAEAEDKESTQKALTKLANMTLGTIALNKYIKEIGLYDEHSSERKDTDKVTKAYDKYIEEHNKEPKKTRGTPKTFKEHIKEVSWKETTKEEAKLAGELRELKTEAKRTRTTLDDVKNKEELAAEFHKFTASVLGNLYSADGLPTLPKARYFKQVRVNIGNLIREVTRIQRVLEYKEDAALEEELVTIAMRIEEMVAVAEKFVDMDVKVTKSAVKESEKKDAIVQTKQEELKAVTDAKLSAKRLGSKVIKEGTFTDITSKVFTVDKGDNIGAMDGVATVNELLSDGDKVLEITTKSTREASTPKSRNVLASNLAKLSKVLDKVQYLPTQNSAPTLSGIRDENVVPATKLKLITNKKTGVVNIVNNGSRTDKAEAGTYNPLTIFAKSEIKEGGEFKLTDSIMEAVKLATINTYYSMQEAMNDTSSNQEKFIKAGYGVELNTKSFNKAQKLFLQGILPIGTFTSSAGQEVLQLAGLRFGRDLDAKDGEAITKALGLLVVASVEQMGLSSKLDKKVDVDYKGDKSGKGSTALTKLTRVNNKEPNIANAVQDLKGAMAYLGVADRGSNTFAKAKPYRQEKVSRTEVAINKHNQEVGEVLNGNALTFNAAFKAITGDLDREDATALWGRLMLKTSGELDSVQSMQVEKELLNNNTMETSIADMLDVWFTHGESKFYTEWEKIKNGRHQTKGATFNMQASHLTRFIASYRDMLSTVKWDNRHRGYNKDDMKVFRLGISQAFDIPVDKALDNKVYEILEEKYVTVNDAGGIEYASTKEGELLQEAVSAHISGDTEAMANSIRQLGGTNHRGHILQAVTGLASLAKAAGSKYKLPFKHSVVLESDAITSGMMLLLLNVGTRGVMKLLDKGGIYLDHKDGDTRVDHKQFKSDSTNSDLYETVTPSLKLVEAPEKVTNGRDLVTFINYLDTKGAIKWRNIVKPSVMVFIYGATLKNVKRLLGSSLGISTVIEALSSNDKEVREETVKFLEVLFPNQLQYKALQNGKLVATAERVPGNVVLTEEQIEHLNGVTTTVYSNTLEESFKEHFGEVIKFRTALKSVEAISFKVFNYKFKELATKKGYLKDGKLSISPDMLSELVQELDANGHGYTAIDASGGKLDYTKFTYELDSKEGVSITGGTGNSKRVLNASTSQKTPENNSGSTAVTTIHSIDDFLMSYAMKTREVLDLYDATFTGANANAVKAVDNEMNNAVMSTARDFNILGEAVDRVEATLSGLSDKELEVILKDDLGKVSDLFDRVGEVDVGEVVKTIGEVRDGRVELLSKKARIGHYMISDEFSPVNVDAMTEAEVKEANDKYSFKSKGIATSLDKMIKLYDDRIGIRDRATVAEIEDMSKVKNKALMLAVVKAGDRGVFIGTSKEAFSGSRTSAELMGGAQSTADVRDGDMVGVVGKEADLFAVLEDGKAAAVMTSIKTEVVSISGYTRHQVSADTFKYIKDGVVAKAKAKLENFTDGLDAKSKADIITLINKCL